MTWTWEIVWPDRVRNYGQSSTDILQQVMQQQFSSYDHIDEFIDELSKRCGIWSGAEINPIQDHDEFLKTLASHNIITLYINGESYNA